MPESSGRAFVGRAQELAELVGVLGAAVGGRGQLVLIAGEPGIGKSRLADEVSAAARELGVRVLWGRAWEDAGAPPFWPWIQALRALLRGVPREALRDQLGSGASDLLQVLPEVGEVVAGLEVPEAHDSESARFQLFDSTASFLRRASADTPLLIVLDDLHAADTASLLLLRFVAGQLSDMPVMVIGTYRDVALTPDHPLTSVVTEVSREPATRIVTLGGLQPSAVGEYIGATAGVVPHDLVAAAVWRETGGNPLFVGEAVRLLSAEGRLADVADLPSLRVAVPPGVRDVIARRLGHLDDGAVLALRTAAALGPEFRVEALRRVLDVEQEALLRDLDDVARAGLITSVVGGLDRFRFSHDLVRETLHDDTSASERVALHRRILSVLEELYADSVDRHLAELAYHAFEAVRVGGVGLPDGTNEPEPGAGANEPALSASGADRAVSYAMRAGERAARSLAFEEAVRLYRMAISVLDEHGGGHEQQRAEILVAVGDALARAGDPQGARTPFLEAAAMARRTGSAPLLAKAALGLGGRLPWARPGWEDQLIPLLRDALVLLGGSEDRLRVRLLTRLACALRSSPDQREQAASFSGEALELARSLQDDATLSYALAGQFWATWWPENPDTRLDLAHEMLTVANGLGDGERRIDAHVMLFLSLSELGRMTEARTALKDVIRLAGDLRQPAQLWLGLAPPALVAIMDGELALADELVAREFEQRLAITPARDEFSAASLHRFLLDREHGRVADAEDIVRAACGEFPWYPVHRAALACLLAETGREDEARTALSELGADDFRALSRDNEWLLGVCLASDACHLLADAARAETLYGQLEPFAGRHAIGHAEGSVGVTDRYLGLLAATMNRLDDAVRHLEDAVDANRGMGALTWVLHSQADLAAVLERRSAPGDRQRASLLRQDVARGARRIGLVALEGIESVRQGENGESPARTGSGRFRREGEYWVVSIDGDGEARIRDSKGMQHLARLLATPGQEHHALDLARGGWAASGDRAGRDSGTELTEQPRLQDAGPMLDSVARAEYRERLRELSAEVAEAEEWNDPERVNRAQQEMEFLAAELGRAVGLGGRDRRASAATERARLSVTRATRAAMRRIATEAPAVGAHLEASVKTGTYLSYAPDPRSPISWET